MGDVLVLPSRGPGTAAVSLSAAAEVIEELLETIGTNRKVVSESVKDVVQVLAQLKDFVEAGRKGIPPGYKDVATGRDPLSQEFIAWLKRWKERGQQSSDWTSLFLWSPDMHPDP